MGVVVLASGGLDSAVLLHRAARAGTLDGVVFCDYGQPAALREWEAMRAILKRIGWGGTVHEVPLTTIAAKPMQSHGEEGPRVVPARNLVMIAHAANYAASIGADGVWWGACRADWADYWDCRPRFLSAVREAIGFVCGVDAPLMHVEKPDVVAEARAVGLLELAWSCYEGGERPCGGCASCRVRLHG